MMFLRKRERPAAPIVHAEDGDFNTAVWEQPGVTVVDFWAPWCGPCRMMEPILEEVAIERAEDGVRIVKVNVDRAPQVSALYGIRSIPTLMFFRDGEAQFEMVGLVPKPVLEREIGELLSSVASPPDEQVG